MSPVPSYHPCLTVVYPQPRHPFQDRAEGRHLDHMGDEGGTTALAGVAILVTGEVAAEDALTTEDSVGECHQASGGGVRRLQIENLALVGEVVVAHLVATGEDEDGEDGNRVGANKELRLCSQAP